MKKAFGLFLLLSCTPSIAKINLDGKLDEQEWSSAQQFTKMMTVKPYVLTEPNYDTNILVTSDEHGIYFGVTSSQPLTTRNSDISARDRGIGSDKIQIMIDFDNNAITAYSFEIGSGGSIRDGLYSSENGFSNEWDGNWQAQTSSNDDSWVAEILIPWDIASMKKNGDDSRKINWYISRFVANENTTYANASTDETRPRFLNDFNSLSIQDFTQSSLQLFGSATVRRDIYNEESTADASLDVFWKSGNGKQLTATINPDFGHVESDGLVVNFSATENFFNERRSFFTENQSLFNVNGTYGLRMIHTRRIGGRSDTGDALASDIDAAVKFTDNRDNYTYGLFAATESSGEGYQGREYFASRYLHKTDKQTVGLTGTYVDRPDINRTAVSYAFNYDYLFGEKLTFKSQVVGANIDDNNVKTDGLGVWTTFSHQINENQIQSLILNHFDENLDINDFGFLPRNNLNSIFYTHSKKLTSYSEESYLQQREFMFNTEYLGNNSGDSIETSFLFSDNWQFKNANSFNWDIKYYSEGVNDLISRGNGLVNTESGNRLSITYRSNNANKLRYHGFIRKTNDFSVGSEFSTHIHPSYYFQDNYNVSLSIFYRDADDWLNWLGDDLFGRYQRELLNTTIDFNANFSKKQELRFRLQWFAIDAKANSQYQLDPNGNLQTTNNDIDDFSLSNVAIQLRYRYEIAPLSNIYLVYSRGSGIFEDSNESISNLFSPGFDNVNSDNFLVKFRYKFF